MYAGKTACSIAQHGVSCAYVSLTIVLNLKGGKKTKWMMDVE